MAVVLLGDLVDRGRHSFECVVLALDRLKRLPTATIWVAGNHDVGHQWSDKHNRFIASLHPAEFSDWLNSGQGDEQAVRRRFGQAFVEFVQDLPRAVAFSSGLLAVHGGVPHIDRIDQLDSLAALQADSIAKSDFTWLRVSESAPRKIPNRSRLGCELGTEQFAASVAHISGLLERLGHPRVTAVARGHDHYPERFFVYRGDFPPMSLVTINSMAGEPEDGAISGDPIRRPCVGNYVPGQVPRVVQFSNLAEQLTAASDVSRYW
jgi:hypothetical protein